MKHIKVFEAFAGYGSQAMACKRLQEDFPDKVSFDYIGIAEIEPAAIKAYHAIHGGGITNYGDITQINWDDVPDFDLFTYSSPCQDFSQAGKQAGAEEGSGTRSSLLWECRRAIVAKKPKYLLFENVKALTQKKFMTVFQRWIDELDSYGYSSFWKVLNAKHYGVPQNRERVFMISILRDGDNPVYDFPKPFPLTKTVEDYMLPAEEVDKSYFISQDRLTNKVLTDILEQPNVLEEFTKLYHREEAFRRIYGRNPKGSEIEQHREEVDRMVKQMEDEANSIESVG